MKTKTLTTLLLFSSITYNAFSQFNLSITKYKWGIGASLGNVEVDDPQWNSWGYAKGNFYNFGDITNKSFSVSITPKYFIRKDVLLRLEFGIAKINLKYYWDSNAHLASNNSPTTDIINQNIQQNIYKFIPGVQWNFLSGKSIEAYLGMTVSYLHYSEMKYENHRELRLLINDSITGGLDDKATATGGFAVGAGAFTGANIYLQKHISLGAEISYSILYYDIGDTFSGEVVWLHNQAPSQTYSYFCSYKGFQSSTILASINLSAWF